MRKLYVETSDQGRRSSDTNSREQQKHAQNFLAAVRTTPQHPRIPTPKQTSTQAPTRRSPPRNRKTPTRHTARTHTRPAHHRAATMTVKAMCCAKTHSSTKHQTNSTSFSTAAALCWETWGTSGRC